MLVLEKGSNPILTKAFHRFCVRFAYNKAVVLEHSAEALVLVEKWLNGEDITEQQLNNAADAVWNISAVAYAAHAAACWTARTAASATRSVTWTPSSSIISNAAYVANVASNWNTPYSEIHAFLTQVSKALTTKTKISFLDENTWKTLLLQALNDNDKDLLNITLQDFNPDITTLFKKNLNVLYNKEVSILEKRIEIIQIIEEVLYESSNKNQ